MKVVHWVSVIFVLALLLFLTLAAQAVPRYTIQDLGTLGGFYSYAWGINDSGQVVGNADALDGRHAFMWQGGSMQDLGTNGGQESAAYEVNKYGQVIGLCVNDNMSHATTWINGTPTDLGTLGGALSVANGINDKGQIVGVSDLANPAYQHGFLYQSGPMTSIAYSADSFTTAVRINEKGDIAATVTTTDNPHAYLYRGGEWLNLQTLSGIASEARDINEKTQVIGEHRVSEDVTSAFIWENGVMRDLGTPDALWSYAFGINDLSQVVGNAWYTAGDGWHGVIWDGTDVYNLDDLISESGWQIDNARDINNGGQIVGSAYHNGEYHAYLMTPVPEPSSVCALAVGLIGIPGLAVMRRRRTH